jgi:hypothetical protein
MGALILVSSQAFALINYTTIGGVSKCCESVGPSGHAASCCVANPSGGTCAARAATGHTGLVAGRVTLPAEKPVNYSSTGM